MAYPDQYDTSLMDEDNLSLTDDKEEFPFVAAVVSKSGVRMSELIGFNTKTTLEKSDWLW